MEMAELSKPSPVTGLKQYKAGWNKDKEMAKRKKERASACLIT
jgi:hypothetical protein